MARPRKQTYPLETYLNSNRDGDISNNADTQRKPAWKSIINGLIVTILTDDYIPPIILAEEDESQLIIVDGGSRTAAFMMYKYGNYKITSSVEDSVIPYKKKNKDKDGNIVWENATFDIKGKTYEQLPNELKKKFNIYQIETVIHENCNDKNKIAKYIKRYNEHTSMNTNQKAFTYLDAFANDVRKIMDSKFFLDYNNYSDNDKEKGVIERVIVESLMCMNHFDNWKKDPKSSFKYINDNATKEEFDRFENNLHRLEKIITEDTKDIFDKKDSFIFLTLFDKFTKLGLEDVKFEEFLRYFKDNRNIKKNGNGMLYDEIKKNNSTKDKSTVKDKLDMLETLLKEFLHINEKQENQVDNVEDFIVENVVIKKEEVEEDMKLYKESLDNLLEDTVKFDSKLRDEANRPSLLAMMAYSYKEDVDLDEWMEHYAKENSIYILNQKENFLHMKDDLNKFIDNENRKSA